MNYALYLFAGILTILAGMTITYLLGKNHELRKQIECASEKIIALEVALVGKNARIGELKKENASLWFAAKTGEKS